MKKLFPGYYKKTEDEIEKIWKNGLIFFDTNVLLNLYRYSDSTSNTILEIMSKFSSQIFLPHQAALEFNMNRFDVIASQEDEYRKFNKKLSEIKEELKNNNKHPFLSNEVNDELNSVLAKVSNELDNNLNNFQSYLNVDPIYDKISELFIDKITEEFSIQELEEIYSEGKGRYDSKIPPGFEDEKNKSGKNSYGDLVLWKQIIKKAQESDRDIILITDERKIDWWWKMKDSRIIGPRQELVAEIKREANVGFHMYSSEGFLRYGEKVFEQNIDAKAFKEIEAVKLDELLSALYDNTKIVYSFDTAYIQDEIQRFTAELNHIEKEMIRIEDELLNFDYDKHIILHNDSEKKHETPAIVLEYMNMLDLLKNKRLELNKLISDYNEMRHKNNFVA